MPKAKLNKETGKMVAQHSAARKAAIRKSDKALTQAGNRFAQTQKNIAAGSTKKINIKRIFFGK